jgi:uncharacterized metal-binding protein
MTAREPSGASTPNCARCYGRLQFCRDPNGRAPAWCPSVTREDLTARALEQYDLPKTLEFARQASLQEAAGYAGRERHSAVSYPVKCRLEETLQFCARIGAHRVGLAFCVGLRHEAAIFTSVFERRGHEVVGIACKVGGVPKERIGLTDADKLRVGQYETMCNPVLQALLLNEAETELNVMLGLCVGHDALFLQHVQGPTTVFAVKDRVTGHNPLAALYTSRSYYRRLAQPSDADQPDHDQEQ